jgi:choline-sulfatase
MPKLTRRSALRSIAAPFAASLLAQQESRAQSSSKPKNVVIIMSDQHRPTALSFLGNTPARTPNIDAFAATAVNFSNCYCSNPVCTPSRASLLTGLYTHNHGAFTNGTPWPFEHKTLAHMFGAAGYMSALIGKMHFVDAQTHGFDYRIDFNDWYQFLGPKTKLYAEELSQANSGSGMPQIDDLWRDFGDPWKDVREKDDRQGFVSFGRVSKIPEEQQFDAFVARESIRFLKQHSGKQPFFLVTSFLRPHDPFMPSQRFADMFKAEDMQLPPSYGKVDLATVPAEVKASIERNRPTPELNNPETARRHMAYYYANLAEMDDNVGKVLRTLRELNLENDTIVLYTSDHGEMLGDHKLWQKFQFYESSCRIPLLVRVPGIAGGKTSKTVVSNVDIAATLAELAGVHPLKGKDSHSFAQDLRTPGTTRDTTVFSEYNLRNPRAKYMVRRGDWKYNFYTHDTPELFNLKDDPQELRNLALVPEFKAKAEELKAQLFAWYKPPEV